MTSSAAAQEKREVHHRTQIKHEMIIPPFSFDSDIVMDLIIVKMREKDESSSNIIHYLMKKCLTEVSSIRQVCPPRAPLRPRTLCS